jgi:hypothetical protein
LKDKRRNPLEEIGNSKPENVTLSENGKEKKIS